MYGVGEGLERGVRMAAPLIMNAMNAKADRDQRERLVDRDLAANAGILAGRSMTATPTSTERLASPAALLANSGSMVQEGSSDPSPMVRQPMQPVSPANDGAAPLAMDLQQQNPAEYTPLKPEQVYEMYRKAADARTQNQIRMADEMDVARGWQKNYSQLSTLTRSLRVIESALQDQDPNRAMMLVPNAQDHSQAIQILSAEHQKLSQQRDSTMGEFGQWDKRRKELGINEQDINSEPGIAQWLNRRQQDRRGTPTVRPGARSILPMPSSRR